ncbi:AIFM3 [Acanthosepion pharaonis]|uniref:AIFM3 n=1 Tax=Acanthosepion pharaonis TaxID=158019 RepID=A0A812DGV9_ACAPH|nr:AIFM3 [Sepia pharaonis]
MGLNTSKPTKGQVNLQAPQNSELDDGPVTGLTYKVKDQSVSGRMPSTNTIPSADESDEVEIVVGNVNDLERGKIKEIEIGNEKALIVKDDGIFAFGSKCTHYGLPLSKGAYCNGRIRCPFHGACFNVKTGDIEDFPGLDSIHTFKVEVENDIVKVIASKKKLTQFRRVKEMANCNSEAQQTFLLIGGGPASLSCAETLRQEDFDGKIIIVTKEDYLPYDRPKLSKAMSSNADSIALRKKEFFTEHCIELQTGKELISLDTDKNSAEFKDGSIIEYNALMIATGGNPRELELPGSDLKNICYLRTPDDANFIDKASDDKNVVIIGSSFIGMEVAAAVIGKASSVNVVCRSDLPFKNVFGTQIAERIMELYKEKGVNFYYNCHATELLGSDGNLTTVVLNNGTSLPADICVVGIGVTPATTFLKDAGVQMNSQGFITVDKHMRTNKERVYAAGDITEFPLFIKNDSVVNVQHYQMAHAQGHNAALNMLGKEQELKSVPFFWSMMFGKSIRYAGYGAGYDDTVVFEDDQKIATFFIKENKAVAVASLNHDPIVAKFAELLFNGKSLSKLDVTNKSNEWLFS